MKTLIIILISISLVYSQTIGPGQPDSRCPPGTSNPPVHLPSNDCTVFLTCIGGLAYPQACPPGQHWSVRYNWCDWPERAECTPSSGLQCPPTNDPVTHFPHENDCTKFYKCDWGTPVLFDCPPGQEFGPQIDRCDWPEVAQCSGTSGPQCPPTNDPITHLPHERDCTRFYKCNWGNPIEFECPPGQEFGPQIGRCDWPEYANCNLGGGGSGEGGNGSGSKGSGSGSGESGNKSGNNSGCSTKSKSKSKSNSKSKSGSGEDC